MSSDLFTSPLPQALGLAIIHSIWQITLFAVLLWCTLRILSRASSTIRYTVALGAMLLSLLCAGATFGYQWMALSSIEELTPQLDTREASDTVNIPVPDTYNTLLHGLNAYAPHIAGLWFGGIMIMGIRLAGSFYYIEKLQRTHLASLPVYWQTRLSALAAAVGCKRIVRGVESSLISSPVALGIFSPVILLPVGMCGGLTTAQIESILVHELYHIKRMDYAVNIIQAFIEVIMFYHPALWWISNVVRMERENCCDDKTVMFCGNPLPYAQALTRLQENNLITKPYLAMSATGSQGRFTARIQRLFNIYAYPSKPKSFIALGIALFALSAFAFLPNEINRVDSNSNQRPPAKTSDGEQHSSINAHKLEATAETMLVESVFKKSMEASIDQLRKKITDTIKDGLNKQVTTLVEVRSNSGGKPLYVIDGNVATEEMRQATKLEDIQSVTVLKDAVAIEKYGKDGQNGVVEIYTNATEKPTLKESTKPLSVIHRMEAIDEDVNTTNPNPVPAVEGLREVVVEGYGENGRNGVDEIKTKPKSLFELRGSATPLYIVDGKEATADQFNALNPKMVRSIEVLNEEAIERYGEKGRQGVIIVQTEATLLAREVSGMQARKISEAPSENMNVKIPDIAPVAPTIESLSVYPNAAVEYATVKFNIAQSGNVVVNVFNERGEVVKKLVDGKYGVGTHEVTWSIQGYNKGSYLIVMHYGDKKMQTRLMVKQ